MQLSSYRESSHSFVRTVLFGLANALVPPKNSPEKRINYSFFQRKSNFLSNVTLEQTQNSYDAKQNHLELARKS